MFFFFKQKTAYEIKECDWSSDVCSSDLTPLSAIHLQNMLRLAELGVVILPAMPGFYHKPQDIEDLVDFVVGKILDSLNIPSDMFKRWGD